MNDGDRNPDAPQSLRGPPEGNEHKEEEQGGEGLGKAEWTHQSRRDEKGFESTVTET